MVNNPDMAKKLAFIIFPVCFLTAFLGANLPEIKIVSLRPRTAPVFKSLVESSRSYSKGVLTDIGFRRNSLDYIPEEEYPSFEPEAPRYNPERIGVNIVERPPPYVS